MVIILCCIILQRWRESGVFLSRHPKVSRLSILFEMYMETLEEIRHSSASISTISKVVIRFFVIAFNLSRRK